MKRWAELWKEEGLATRYNILSSTRKKVRWRIDIYLETISTTVNWTEKYFLRRLVEIGYINIKETPKFWQVNRFINFTQKSESCLEYVALNQKVSGK